MKDDPDDVIAFGNENRSYGTPTNEIIAGLLKLKKIYSDRGDGGLCSSLNHAHKYDIISDDVYCYIKVLLTKYRTFNYYWWKLINHSNKGFNWNPDNKECRYKWIDKRIKELRNAR